jgi:L-phenylalanine/L-methionine N-acetyltransferase
VARLGRELRTPLRDGREVRVRDAHPRDARPLTRLLDEVAAEPEATLLMLPGQFGAGVWRRRIGDAAGDPRSLLLVAEVDGELAGNLGLHPDPHPCSAHVAVIGMSVGRAWRRLGVGGILLETAADWAAAHGVLRLTLGVFPENAPALRLYERHGFVREGLRVAHYARAGKYHDEVLMARPLTPQP